MWLHLLWPVNEEDRATHGFSGVWYTMNSFPRDIDVQVQLVGFWPRINSDMPLCWSQETHEDQHSLHRERTFVLLMHRFFFNLFCCYCCFITLFNSSRWNIFWPWPTLRHYLLWKHKSYHTKQSKLAHLPSFIQNSINRKAQKSLQG